MTRFICGILILEINNCMTDILTKWSCHKGMENLFKGKHNSWGLPVDKIHPLLTDRVFFLAHGPSCLRTTTQIFVSKLGNHTDNLEILKIQTKIMKNIITRRTSNVLGKFTPPPARRTLQREAISISEACAWHLNVTWGGQELAILPATRMIIFRFFFSKEIMLWSLNSEE